MSRASAWQKSEKENNESAWKMPLLTMVGLDVRGPSTLYAVEILHNLSNEFDSLWADSVFNEAFHYLGLLHTVKHFLVVDPCCQQILFFGLTSSIMTLLTSIWSLCP